MGEVTERKLNEYNIKNLKRDAWLAQLVQHIALNLKVVTSSPMLGVGAT